MAKLDKLKVKSFKLFTESLLLEGNPLWHKLEKWGSKNVHIGAVSPERDYMDADTKKLANKNMTEKLEAARQNGLIGGWSGPHLGGYQYDDSPTAISKENSYFVHAKSSSEEDHNNMLKTLYHVGNYLQPKKEDNQESILLISPDRKVWWQYLHNSSTPGKIEYKGTIEHRPPKISGVGFTAFNKKQQYAFTSSDKDNYDYSEHPYTKKLQDFYRNN